MKRLIKNKKLLSIVIIIAVCLSFSTFQLSRSINQIERPNCPNDPYAGVCPEYVQRNYRVRGFPISYYHEQQIGGIYEDGKINGADFILNSVAWFVMILSSVVLIKNLSNRAK